jgi:hypothetical protein
MKDRLAKAMHCAIADVMDGKVLDPVCLEPILAVIALNKARHAVEMAECRLESALKRAGLSHLHPAGKA